MFFFQAWLPCFAFLCTAEAVACATKRSADKIVGSMVLVIGLPVHFARIAAEGSWEIWSLWSVLECGPQIFPPASQPVSPFFGAQGYREIKIAADRIYHHQAGVRKNLNPPILIQGA